MRPYTDLIALQFFVLEESWVLRVEARPRHLELEVDFVFAKDHPELLAPRAGEFYYSRVGLMTFADVTDLSWTRQAGGPHRDPDGTEDWGSIDIMTWQGRVYEFEGDFGIVRVEAASLNTTFTGPILTITVMGEQTAALSFHSPDGARRIDRPTCALGNLVAIGPGRVRKPQTFV